MGWLLVFWWEVRVGNTHRSVAGIDGFGFFSLWVVGCCNIRERMVFGGGSSLNILFFSDGLFDRAARVCRLVLILGIGFD